MKQALAIRKFSNKCAKVLVVTSWTPFSKSARMCFFKNAGLSEFHFLDLSRPWSILQRSFLFFFFQQEPPSAGCWRFFLFPASESAFEKGLWRGGGASKLGDRRGVLEEL